MVRFLDDTIAAISTPQGQGAIGIIRLSGKKSFQIISAIFSPTRNNKERSFHALVHGTIQEGERILDQVLIARMPKGHSYTGEEMAEIHAHGGVFVLSQILEVILKQGARLAVPGEFTFRAFMNGKIDLSQAEAVIDVIEAKSQTALEVAHQHLQGRFSKEILWMKENILEVLAHTEAAIDFSTEDIDIFSIKTMMKKTNSVMEKVKTMLKTYQHGKLLREGALIVIVGKPNVGKSSLFNALLHKDRAIVTEEAGTTRDTVEEDIIYQGVLLRLVDTAGIRDAQNKAEKIGINHSLEKINMADVILLVLDGSSELEKEDMSILDQVHSKKKIVVINKADVRVSPKTIFEDILKKFNAEKIQNVSALKKEGIQDLMTAIYQIVTVGKINSEEVLLAKERHKDALEKAAIYLQDYQRGLLENKSLEFLALDLKSALEELEEIVGHVSNEDVYDKIFSSFCIGK